MSVTFRWRQGDRVRQVVVLELARGHARVTVDGAEIALEVMPLGDGRMRLTTPDLVTMADVTASGTRHDVRIGAMDFTLEREPEDAPDDAPGDAPGVARRRRTAHAGGLEAPMPGLVTRVLVAVGDAVKKGQPLVALEAMKMEHLIRAPRDGRVIALPVKAGEMVQGGVALVEIGD